jgi:hypothetical protein
MSSSAVFGLDRLDGPSLPDKLLLRFFVSRRFYDELARVLNLESVLEENARANPDARICPLTHASVNRARQAELIGRNSSFSILIAIRRSPNL